MRTEMKLVEMSKLSYFGEHISEWESFNPLPHIIKLCDELLKELML
jgi:hypothetical protein